ncbi:MAG: hypothetical protein MH472_09380 [Bacteroidia bacterium]|nr:hypothetical protein [Bacteroidia bacterium]
MIRKVKYVIATTHIDKHGCKMTESALESMLPFLNGERKPRVGLEHERTFPPFGVTMNGQIEKRNDEHHYLIVELCYFDQRELITLDDGTQLLKEYFSEGEYPFVECADSETSKVKISTDPVNFDTRQDVAKIYEAIKEVSEIEFEVEEFGRKSEIPDPETIITITREIALTLGIIKSKIPAKLGEAIGEDLAKFYKFISKLTVETIKKVKPENRPKNFVISYPNKDCNIELVIKTYKADRVLNSLTKEKLQIIANKVEQLANLRPEKIQFIYGENDNWEFNYLLSKNGAVIGTIKTFNNRNELYNSILEKQKTDERKSS